MGIISYISGVLSGFWVSPKAARGKPEPVQQLGDIELIVVEDDERMKFTYSQIFEKNGLDGVVLPNLPAELPSSPKTVILDALPSKDALLKIRRQLPSIKIGLVSQSTGLELARDCELAGIAEYLVKPISAKAFLFYIEKLKDSAFSLESEKFSRAETRKDFLRSAEHTCKLFQRADMSQELFCQAHGISTSKLAYELKLSDIPENTKKIISKNLSCFKKSYLTDVGLSLDRGDLHKLCLEIVRQVEAGEKVDLDWVKKKARALQE
jgi:CheY-like chemotaxis protein